ncbi:hypothetical protein CTT31_10715 [Pseudoalteromonas maricaloris]|uniref:hypothetical protein n=1 Tax=Pseudoalteromonas maricaloris TaxID=184924 RepID=UPI0021ADE5A0|nr:hypothetical protein [Pseudoalteromonas flavipulchra]USE69579.1 hypothetical protein CTT31_10715 [Pseudoalteromonas flavipulchra]
MEELIPITLITILLFIQIKMYKNLCKHLARLYPEEWHKLTKHTLGTSQWSLLNATVSESLKTGFFSTVSDNKVKTYIQFRKYNLVAMSAVLSCNFVLVVFN